MTAVSSEDATIANALKHLKVQGRIVALVSGGFEVSGGTGVGTVIVKPSAGTSLYYNRLTPAVGKYVIVTGTGTYAAFKPNFVGLFASTPGTTSVSGQVMSEQPYGAVLKVSTTGGYMPLPLSTATKVTGSLGIGSHITATGVGAISPAIFPTSITPTGGSTGGGSGPTPAPTNAPAPTGGVPLHVMTAAIVYGYAGTPASVPLASVKPYVTWAQTDEAYAAELRANGIKVDIYGNPWRNYLHDNPNIGYLDLKPGGAHAAAEAKTCSGTVIFDKTYSGGYEADAQKPAALGHVQTLMNYRMQEYRGNYDAIFTDDTDSMGGIPLPCGYVQSTYITKVNAIDSALKVKIFFNGFGNVAVPSSQIGLLAPSNVLGGMCEICLAGNDKTTGKDTIQTGGRWQGIITAEILTVARHKIFWNYARPYNDAASEIPLRKYIYASFLLGYDPNYAMLQEAFHTNSGFAILPETGLVPMKPLTTATTVGGYLRSGGAYMREFGACYYRGVNKGKCAVVINPNSSTVKVPTTAYAHSLELVGSGVLDKGYAAFTGGRVTSLAAATAAILFQ